MESCRNFDQNMVFFGGKEEMRTNVKIYLDGLEVGGGVGEMEKIWKFHKF